MTRRRPSPPENVTVYWLLDANDHPLYIGQTIDLRRRLSEHALKPYWPQVVSVATREPTFRANARQIESWDIYRLKPPCNIDGVANMSARRRASMLSALGRKHAAHRAGSDCGWANCRDCRLVAVAS